MVWPYTQASQSGVGVLAISAGVPVVVSDLGSLPELAYDSSFVFEAANPRALAQTILRHLDDGADVRGAVLRHAQGRFSLDRAAQLSTELYGELVARRSSSPRRHDPLVRARERALTRWSPDPE
jgi:glycosyltransferase involved in cell wall biosynthesis